MDKVSRFRELIRLQQDSGLSVRDFCLNEGISYSTFYYWRKKLRLGGKNNGNFIPLVVKPAESAPANGFSRSRETHKIQPSQLSVDPGLLVLVYPNGTSLKINGDLDLAHLRALIHLGD